MFEMMLPLFILALILFVLHRDPTGKNTRESTFDDSFNCAPEQSNTPQKVTVSISLYEFEAIVKNSKQHIKRLISLTNDGAIVYGIVRSQSGISEWYFKIDFDDYGNITGRYWLSSDNDDSEIPYVVAGRIQSGIERVLKEHYEDFEQ